MTLTTRPEPTYAEDIILLECKKLHAEQQGNVEEAHQLTIAGLLSTDLQGYMRWLSTQTAYLLEQVKFEHSEHNWLKVQELGERLPNLREMVEEAIVDRRQLANGDAYIAPEVREQRWNEQEREHYRKLGEEITEWGRQNVRRKDAQRSAAECQADAEFEEMLIDKLYG